MSWASRRKSIYLSIVVVIAIIILAPIAFLIFNKEPTCFDNKRNGDEIEIDCGGSCEKLCESQTLDPVVLWSRSFKITGNTYNSVAYVKNPNLSGGISKVQYTFKLFDDKNVLIAERKGSTYISPNTVNPIFEGSISTGERVPMKTFFELSKPFEWSKIDDNMKDLSISDIRLSNLDLSPRVDATLSNPSILDMSEIEVTVIVFDINDNAIATSNTFIERLPNRSTRNIVFTWPNRFDRQPSRVEIIPRIHFGN